jgi:hypothetical protein
MPHPDLQAPKPLIPSKEIVASGFNGQPDIIRGCELDASRNVYRRSSVNRVYGIISNSAIISSPS